jgi:hypothetical protein
MGGGYTPGPYWKCDECGIDCHHKDAGNLFRCSDEELDVILKSDPEFRAVMAKIRNRND